MLRHLILVLAILAGLSSCKQRAQTTGTPVLPKDVGDAYSQLPDKLDYNIHVKPILSDKCFACHGPDKNKQKAGLRLDFAEFAYANLAENPDKVAIDPGSLDNSEV